MHTRRPALVVHGGLRESPPPAEEMGLYRRGVSEAAAAGWQVLMSNGGALDAVEAAVCALEDNPVFNAGRGAALTEEGTVELDAAIMEGGELRCGAVAAVAGIAHPVTLARRVMEDGRHVLLAGEGARQFARAAGVPECDPATLVTERRRRDWQARRVARSASADDLGGTVGAVALDERGLIAAATSTGGTTAKLPGRVGDSPLIGCGTYADNTVGGVSCTGDGEAIIRVVLACRLIDAMAAGGDPEAACRAPLRQVRGRGRGSAGAIVVTAGGATWFGASDGWMPVAVITSDRAEPWWPWPDA